MKLTKLTVLFLFVLVRISAQVNYSPAYFGPSANPVPEFSNATIVSKTTCNISANNFFGFGDNTQNLYVAFEIPLLPSFVSLKMWGNFLERYNVTPEITQQRNMNPDDLNGFISGGDIFVQTRMLLSKEKTYMPAIILNSTLKTASSDEKEEVFVRRRYFDTPGYYFDVEFGKSVKTNSRFLTEIRTVGNFGFLCWETTDSRQNDALMYGGKIILSNTLFDFKNTLSGYKGWMNNGDNPLVYTAKLQLKQKRIAYNFTYKYGIRDYPYHLTSFGVSFSINKLTPKYRK